MGAKNSSLKEYEKKRDFKATSEPEGKHGKSVSKPDAPVFVIQKHDASRLHYDFRLEVDGVLKSWAIPKGPSTDPNDKRLAVMTEDHPMDYVDFEGVIPADNYGAGTVIVWDAGTYRNLKEESAEDEPMSMAEAVERGEIVVFLNGRKIKGGYALIHSKMGGQEKNWLLIKKNDQYADARRNPTATEPKSVLSEKTIEELREEVNG